MAISLSTSLLKTRLISEPDLERCQALINISRGAFLEGQTQDSIFSQSVSLIPAVMVRAQGAAAARERAPSILPLHALIDPGCLDPAANHSSLPSPGTTPITRPLTRHTNVIRSSQMLLGAAGEGVGGWMRRRRRGFQKG